MPWPITSSQQQWPLAAGADLSDWDLFIQLWYALRERAIVIGQVKGPANQWPPTSLIWESGLIVAASLTSLTLVNISDGGPKSWASPGAGLDNPWASVDPFEGAPADWDVVIDDPDYRRCVHAQILLWTSGGQLSISDLTPFVVRRTVQSAASLVAKKAYIIKRDGKWAHEKVPRWPNSREYHRGTVAEGSTASSIVDGSRTWTPNQHLGKDLVFVDAVGNQQRGRINGQSGKISSISGATAGPVVGAYYWICGAEAYFEANRQSDPLFAAYSGLKKSYYSRHPLASSMQKLTLDAASSFAAQAETASPDAAIWPTVSLKDNDWYNPVDAVLGLKDHYYNPDVPRCIRYLQAWIEQYCDNYIERPGRRFNVNNQVLAALFEEAGIGSPQEVTITGCDGTGLYFAITCPFFPIDIHYAIYDDHTASLGGEPGELFTWGSYVTYDGTKLLGDWTGFEDLIGKKIVTSFGWPRPRNNKVRYLAPKTCFRPSEDEDTEEPVFPPTEEKTGQWRTRPASTHYQETDDDQIIYQPDRPEDAFVNGDLARYVGDNFEDPTTGILFASAHPAWADYDDKFFTGSTPDSIHSDSGKITASTRWSIKVDKHYWSDAGGGPAVHVESGTLTSVGNGVATDATKAGSPWWAADRHEDIATSADIGYRHFMLEVDVDGDGSFALPVPLTSASGATGQMGFGMPAEALLAAGMAYEIREPGTLEINAWQGAELTILRADGTVFAEKIKVTHSSDDAFCFALLATEPPVDGIWRITRPRTSTTWKWNAAAAKWEVPEGIDARAGKAFGKQNAIEPGFRVRYGKMRKNDRIGSDLLNPIYRAINALRRAVRTFDWYSNGTLNHHSGNPVSEGGSWDFSNVDTGWEDMKAGAEANWAGNSVVEVNEAPGGTAMGSLDWSETEPQENWVAAGTIFRRKNRGRVTGVVHPTGVVAPPAVAEFWIWCTVVADAVDEDFVTGEEGLGTFTEGALKKSWIFDTAGEVGAWREWTMFDEVPVDGAGEAISRWYGDLTQIAWPGITVADCGVPNHTVYKGHRVSSHTCIVSWQFTYRE